MYYVIGITSYDNDHMLFETHIGTSNMDLLYSAWGKTEKESKDRAADMVKMYNQFLEILPMLS